MQMLQATQILQIGSSIREAMALINKASIKLCVVTDGDGRLLGTISDGDIRRALLAGMQLDQPIDNLKKDGQVVAFESGTEPSVLLDALDRYEITAVVLVDADGKPVELIDRAALHRTILLSPPHMGETETGYVAQAFEHNWIAPAGPNLTAFEARLATLASRSHAVALSSGTAGLHLALRALNLTVGDTVYVSDLTFVASLQPLYYERLSPVLIDCSPGTWNMSPEALERALARDAAAGSLPRAIVLVHLYGQSAEIGRIIALAETHGVPVVEDAAESLGATYENRPSGAHGLISVFSFNGNKIITTSGGGALLTDDAEIADRVRLLSAQGRDPAEHYQHSEIAYNYRMSNILAGIGLGQLDVLAERVAARRRIFQRYVDGLSDVPGLGFQADAPGSVGNRWLTAISFDPNYVALHPYQILRRLRGMGIETRPGWKPMHMQPLAYGARVEPHSNAEMVSARHFLTTLCLPTGSSLSDAQQDRIIEALRMVIREGAV